MNKTKMIVDVIMLLFFILVMSINITGTLLHELVGVGIWLLFVVHLSLNSKWIGAITKNFFKSSIRPETKINYLVDWGIFIALLIETLSGIFISEHLFTFIRLEDIPIWTNAHTLFAYITAGLMTIHLLMHFKMIAKYIEKGYENDGIYNSGIKAKLVAAFVFVLAIFTYLFGLVQYKVVGLEEKTPDIPSDEYSIPENTTTQNTIQNNITNNTTTDMTTNTTITNNTTVQTNEDNLTTQPVESDEAAIQKLLSSIRCTGCSKRCLLTNPRCGVGERQAQIVIEQYHQSKGQ